MITGSDLGLVELTAILWDKLNRKGAEMKSGDMGALMRCFGQLGKGPINRKQITGT